MENDSELLRVYNNEKVKLTSGKNYTIRMAKPRLVEILVATGDPQENNNLRIKIDSDDILQRYPCMELSKDVTPSTELPQNSKLTIQIPETARQPVFNLFPNAGNTNNPIQLPLKSFIDIANLDPVKMFVYYPKEESKTPVIELDKNTSYLNDIDFSPVSNDDGTLLFSQEMQNPLTIADGPVEIDSITDELCKKIAYQVLDTDYEEYIDKEKLKKEEGDKYWTAKRGITAGAVTGKAVWNHRQVLKDFGFKGKFYIKTVKGKQYVIFRGYSGLRKWYTGTRYRVTNPKVINLSAAGKLKSGLKGNAVTILIVGAIDIADWMLSDDEDKQFEDLCVTLGMDALKVVVGSIVTAGFSALVLLFVSSTAPVWMVIGGTIVLGIFVGWGVDWLDQKVGTTNYMKGKGREVGSFLEDAWQENVVEPLGRMYYQLEKFIENMYLRQIRVRW